MTNFTRLTLAGWRQFDSIDLDLTSRILVLTGANGTGKTSILSVLSNHFGWNLPFAATPYVSKRQQRHLYRDIRRETGEEEEEQQGSSVVVGSVQYDNGQVCQLVVPTFHGGGSYSVTYHNRQEIVGLFIPSHRPQTSYTSVTTIPTRPVEASQMYEQYRSLLSQYYSDQQRLRNPGAIQKEALISLAVFGEGNSSVAPNAGYSAAFTTFESRLRTVLPKELGFRRIKIVMPDVVLETASGDFSLDAMSGGVSSVFSTVWQIHMFDLGRDKYTIIMDEPENHLHPSMQRTLLPSLGAAFPQAKFIVATHSPFIISSFRDANVYALSHLDGGGVVSQRLSEKDLSGSANSVLREILGLQTTLPVWAEDELASEIEASKDLDPQERASRLMSKMKQIGLSGSFDSRISE